jgi:hypothetical protein
LGGGVGGLVSVVSSLLLGIGLGAWAGSVKYRETSVNEPGDL